MGSQRNSWKLKVTQTECDITALMHLCLFSIPAITQKLGTGSQVSGITLSTEQVKRANELAGEQGVKNAEFQVMDALKMTFPVSVFNGYLLVVDW